MTPRLTAASSASGDARIAARLRRALLGSAAVVALLWVLLVPVLAALPGAQWPAYGAAALLLSAVYLLGIGAAGQRLGRPEGPADELWAALSLAALGALSAGGFALLWRARAGAGWAASLASLQAGLSLCVALGAGLLVHHLRAPLRASSPAPTVDDPRGALPYGMTLGVLATGLILGGWLLCAGAAMGHAEAQSERRAQLAAQDLVAVVATAAVHHPAQVLTTLLRGLAASVEPAGFLVLVDQEGRVVPPKGPAPGTGARLLLDGKRGRCGLAPPASRP